MAMPSLNLQSHLEAEDLRDRTNPSTCHELLGRGSLYETHQDPRESKGPRGQSQVAVAASAVLLTLVSVLRIQKNQLHPDRNVSRV